MRASIIIISYNGSKYLDSCISSVMSEIGLEDEIIVVDNGSEDGSAGLVRQQFPQVRLFCNKHNLGFAAACNQGAKLADGETLVFLNQDTVVQPGWLGGLLEPLEQEPSIGLVTSKICLMSDPDRIQMCGQEVHFTGFTFGRGYMEPSNEFRTAERIGAVSGASFAIRRSLWEELGGFDELLFMYYEETDLSWRARLAGYDNQLNPDSVVMHDYSLGSSRKVHDYSQRNRLILLFKNWKVITLILLLPSLLLAEIIDWGYMVMVGWDGLRAKIHAYGWLVKNIPELLKSRLKAQTSRKEPDWVVLNACTSKLLPRNHTGGWLGKLIIYFCNLWFTLHYRIILSLTHRLNI